MAAEVAAEQPGKQIDAAAAVPATWMVTGRSMLSCARPGATPAESAESPSEATPAHRQMDERSVMLLARSPARDADQGIGISPTSFGTL